MAWGRRLVVESGIAKELTVWWDEYDSYVSHDGDTVVILLDRRLFLDDAVPDSVLRSLLAHEVGHAWSREFKQRTEEREAEIDADDFAATATCGHCAAACVQIYHDFHTRLGETFVSESKTHLSVVPRMERIRATFADPGYCTCQQRVAQR